MKNLYESFHKESKIQKRIISENNFTYFLLLRVIIKYVNKNHSVLDIGCGVGTLDFYLSKKVKSILGIDISANAITSAEKTRKYLKLDNVTFKRINFPNKIPTEKYDVIMCCEVIEHLVDDELALHKMNNLLKKGGIAIISTPSSSAPLHRLGLAKNFDERVGHLRRYTSQDLINLSLRNGFRVKEVQLSEGIIRNFLFVNPVAGKFVRFIKYYLVNLVTFLDSITLTVFGESNIILILQKTS